MCIYIYPKHSIFYVICDSFKTFQDRSKYSNNVASRLETCQHMYLPTQLMEQLTAVTGLRAQCVGVIKTGKRITWSSWPTFNFTAIRKIIDGNTADASGRIWKTNHGLI
jgi:hypothetical protein